MKAPFFSLIIPTYNVEETIERALKSILDQTFANYEVVVMDGASKDATGNIVNKYAWNDTRIKWTSQEDNGTYDAMNKGVRLAEGNWIYFLGSDDYLYSDRVLELVHKEIVANEAQHDFLYGNVNHQLLNTIFDGESNKVKMLKKNIPHQAIFYNKDIFEKVGYFNLKYKIAADYELNLRCFFNSNIKTRYIDLIIANFSKGGLSSRTFDSAFFKDYADIIRRVTKKELTFKELRKYCHSKSILLYHLTRKLLRAVNLNVESL